MFSGIIAFITSFIGLLPQIIKSLKTRSTQDLSMIMLINYLICSVAWIIYGSSTNSFFVISSNIVGLIVSLLLILLKRHYDARCN
nr:SemiSWEET family transporter [Fluoribacter dumoffii]